MALIEDKPLFKSKSIKHEQSGFFKDKPNLGARPRKSSLDKMRED